MTQTEMATAAPLTEEEVHTINAALFADGAANEELVMATPETAPIVAMVARVGMDIFIRAMECFSRKQGGGIVELSRVACQSVAVMMFRAGVVYGRLHPAPAPPDPRVIQ